VACFPGFVPRNSTVSCEPGGWDVDSVTCLEIPDYCVAVPVGNGTMLRGAAVGANAVVQCVPGYAIALTPTCVPQTAEAGNWSVAPVCRPLPSYCQAQAFNGTAISGAIHDQRTAYCDEGYEAVLVTCSVGGMWMPAPACDLIWDYCSTLAVAYGASIGPSRVGQLASVSCGLGYEYDGAVVTCLPDGVKGRWSTTPACTSMTGYCDPLLVVNGDQDVAAAPLGAAGNVACAMGFDLPSVHPVECSEGDPTQGEWTMLDEDGNRAAVWNITCIQIDAYCPQLQLTHDGLDCCAVGGARVGDRVPVACLPGFASNATLTSCLPKTAYAGVFESFMCIPVSCGMPPAMPHAKLVSAVEVKYPGLAVYTCDPGYSRDGTLEGSGEVHWPCTETGAFDTRSPCQDISYCSELPQACGLHGTCQEEAAGYSCACDVGYAPTQSVGGVLVCENIDDCATNLCRNQGVCVDGIRNFTCVCAPGFIGRVCDVCEVDHFGPTCRPCSCEQGTCAAGFDGDGQCTCVSGWWGACCDRECPGGDVVCSGHGVCSDGAGGSGACTCMDRYAGSACEECKGGWLRTASGSCDRCNSTAWCDHGACSAAPDGSNDAACVCDFGWQSGPAGRCSQCDAVALCSNRAQCSDADGTCGSCVAGYAGEACHCWSLGTQEALPCSSSTTARTCQCTCKAGWQGEACEVPTTALCNDRGTPDPLTGSCTCQRGFTASSMCASCDSSVRCYGRGTCDSSTGSCSCDTMLVGGASLEAFNPSDFCLTPINQVACHGHGSFDVNSWRCTCDGNFDAEQRCAGCLANYFPAGSCTTHCEASSTCSSRGTCSVSGACTCNSGFAGSRCNLCSANMYPAPPASSACSTYCEAASTCSGHGFCTSSGTCTCAGNYAGSGCSACAGSYYAYPACNCYKSSSTSCALGYSATSLKHYTSVSFCLGYPGYSLGFDCACTVPAQWSSTAPSCSGRACLSIIGCVPLSGTASNYDQVECCASRRLLGDAVWAEHGLNTSGVKSKAFAPGEAPRAEDKPVVAFLAP